MAIAEKIGRYRLTARIGSGGMGEVWRAWDSDLLRDVAIKRLTRVGADPDASLDRLREEARRACSLRHPAVVSVYDVVREGNETYLIEEFIEGVPLRSRIGQPFPLPEFLTLAIPVTEAMAALAARGILHCDLKPENIMIDLAGEPRIVDFGLARSVGRARAAERIAEGVARPTGGIGGTPGYAAPELWRGQAPDARADVFSLGVIFYEMLTGLRPFDAPAWPTGPEPASIQAVLPPRESRTDLPATLNRLVLEMLSADPDRRPAAATVRATLHSAERRSLRRSRSRTPMRRPEPPAWASLPARPLLYLLPFRPVSGEAAEILAASGLTAAVRARLQTVRGLDLADPPRGRVPALEFGGTVGITDGRIRVTGRLASADFDQAVFDETEEGDARKWMPIRDHLCDRLIRELAQRYPGAIDADLPTVSCEARPGREEYVQGLARMQMAVTEADRDAAIALLESASRSDPGFAPALAALASAHARRYHATRDIRLAARADEEAHRALALAPAYPEVRQAIGEVHLTTGKAARAAQVFREILAEDPGNCAARVGLALALAAADQTAEAERNFLEAVRTQPEAWSAHNRLGEFYVRQGRIREALRAFLRVVELAPGYAPGFSNVGVAYQYLNRKCEAIEAYRRSTEIHPNYPALSNMATLLRSEGQFEEAAATYEQALRLNDRDYRVWGNLGSTYDLMPNREAEAERCFRRAIDLAERQREVNPSDAVVLAHLAQFFAELGQKVVARQHIERALELGGDRANLRFLAAAVFEDFGVPDDRARAAQELIRALELGLPTTSVEAEPVFHALRRNRAVAAALRAAVRREQSARAETDEP